MPPALARPPACRSHRMQRWIYRASCSMLRAGRLRKVVGRPPPAVRRPQFRPGRRTSETPSVADNIGRARVHGKHTGQEAVGHARGLNPPILPAIGRPLNDAADTHEPSTAVSTRHGAECGTRSLSRNSGSAFLNHNRLGVAGSSDTTQGSSQVPQASFQTSSAINNSWFLAVSCG